MIRKTFSALILLILLTSCSIRFEEKVCQCLSTNFSQAKEDYEQILDSIESDLIANGIIDHTVESRVQQLRNVAQHGEIKESRTYENIFWEQRGTKTMYHCVQLHAYGDRTSKALEIFNMFKELEQLSLNQEKSIDLTRLRKEIAEIILRYDTAKMPKLSKFVQIDYLYKFAEMEEFKSLSSIFVQKDTSNTVKLHLEAAGILKLEETEIAKDEICNELKAFLLQQKGIYLISAKNTLYRFYLDVYNSIKECIATLRNEKSIELYNKEFEQLNEPEKAHIQELIPFRIIETSPR